jgi:hypothetical protein
VVKTTRKAQTQVIAMSKDKKKKKTPKLKSQTVNF